MADHLGVHTKLSLMLPDAKITKWYIIMTTEYIIMCLPCQTAQSHAHKVVTHDLFFVCFVLSWVSPENSSAF